jgi:hypothetical protein
MPGAPSIKTPKQIPNCKGLPGKAGSAFNLSKFFVQFPEEPAFSFHENAARGDTIRKLKSFGRLAQRLEHPVYTRKVVRSNRTLPTN